MKKNRGYTLIEMIIVIAIMAILAGMSFITIFIIKQAKANAVVSTLNNQIASLQVKTRALSEAKDSHLAMMIVKNSKSVEYANSTGATVYAKAGTYSVFLGNHDGSTFTFKTNKNGEIVPETVLTELVDIRYTAGGNISGMKAAGTEVAVKDVILPETDNDKNGDGIDDFDLAGRKCFLIEYNKANGTVRYGAGTYEIIYGGNVIGSVYLDQETGSHSLK